ncbi:acyl-CoA dehydrogenase [Rhizobium sp. AN80A]|uniref:acyl-CoA dehydrogenase n=1 Tax=Rhizobium sp. AN80A TaxID=3040673 RepID=UPI0024B38D8C|nr:acyl-CoA dehydrogenase [Rhizobium sp. AN80A]
MSEFDTYLGRSRQATDMLDPWKASALAAVLGRGDTFQSGDALPILWQWVFFLPVVSQAETGDDGHPRRGDFLPPVPLHRRMFAGGRTTIRSPLKLGTPAVRRETIERIEEKQGRNGPMVLVTVSYRFVQDGVTCLEEEQSYVYLDPQPGNPGQSAGQPIPDAALSGSFTADAVRLFRFSALTFNSHRIHYDHPYATGVEGYPDLVVHGPLTAMMLSGLAETGGAAVSSFSFRAQKPLFRDGTVSLRGSCEENGAISLTAFDQAGAVAMTAEALRA